jgi:hypothetical protein
MMKKLILLFSSAIVALGLAGCNGADGDLGQTLQNNEGTNLEAEIKRIEADKTMPPQAKQAALGQLKSRQAQGKILAESAQKKANN